MMESILIAALLMSFGVAWLPGIIAYLTTPAEYVPHAPIHIEGDGDFTAANGVRGGNGTPSNPYVIADWVIDMSLFPDAHAGIWLEKTNAHVVVRHCRIVHLDRDQHFYALETGRYPGESTTPSIGPPVIDLTSNITFLDNDLETRVGYGIQIAEGSSHVLVRGNRIHLHPDGGAGRNNRYAINAGRNTHDVAIEGNSIDASSALYATVGIHLSDSYVSEARRATNLSATNNTVTNALTGIQVESSRSTRIEGNRIFWMAAWNTTAARPRGIVLRQSALDAHVSGNAIHAVATAFVVGSAGPDNYRMYGSILGASNGTFAGNEIDDVQVGFGIGNVSGTRVYPNAFSTVRWMEFDLTEEGGAPRDLALGDALPPGGRIRLYAPGGEVPIAFNWTKLDPGASYYLNVTGPDGTSSHSIVADGTGRGRIALRQPRTVENSTTVYAFAGPPRPSGAPLETAPRATRTWSPESALVASPRVVRSPDPFRLRGPPRRDRGASVTAAADPIACVAVGAGRR